MDLEPKEIAIIPRGLLYRVELLDGSARGFVCENYGQKFALPSRGPIGANCLANRRDFKTPVAAFEDRQAPSTVTIEWCGQFHVTEIGHSPLDVVARHGNYAPCKYDLGAYRPVGAVLFDHPDPSIFTMLTAPSGVEGTANIDFVLFRERWAVAENTFRPPWNHKNVMSELMGNILRPVRRQPAGLRVGRDEPAQHHAAARTRPRGVRGRVECGARAEEARGHDVVYVRNSLSAAPDRVRRGEAPLQDDYIDCWTDLEKQFDGTPGLK